MRETLPAPHAPQWVRMSGIERLDRPLWVEAVSKLEITRFSGAALPFPKCREADTEHSGGSPSPLAGPGTRFYTASVDHGP